MSCNTIKKWLQEPSGSEPKYQRAKATGKLTPFEPKLLLAWEADSHRLKRDRRTALMLFEVIQEEGYTGCHAIVT
ncbi:MAG: hypothetical protein M3P47_02825 [Pseudomonadota bacterium]|nr:hypothetical protein [Pseudomonadota bacterium]